MMHCALTFQGAASGRFRKRGVLAAAGLAALLVLGAVAQAASPDLQTSVPRGGQRGTEVRVTFTGNRLDDVQGLLFHYPGITAKDIKAIDSKKVEATLVIAPDCRLGEHHIRLRCKSGTSYARTFWVSQFPNVDEVEPNDDFAKPQPIPLNVTVEGVAKSEETDYYKVTAKKGQRLSVEIEGLRINTLRNVIAIDPFVSIYNKDRIELASADGSALLKQESIVSTIIPEDGDYIVEVRDSAYQGRGRYRAHIGTFPRPTGVYPAGGKAGSEFEATLIGDPLGDYKQKVKLPGTGDEYQLFAARDGLLPPSPNRMRIANYDNALETEPNNSYKEASPSGALPRAFNGVLQEDGDIDYFKFSAKKGQRFRFQVYAQKIGSPVDPVLYIYNAKMKGLGSSDDVSGSKDSRIDFSCPADGEYFVRINDMLQKGGRDFVYRIETEEIKPSITVTMPEMLRRDTQYRKQFAIPQGNSYAMLVSVARSGFSGDAVFEMPKLPAGVTWESGTIPKTVSQYPILLKAAPTAPIAGGMYELYAKSTDPKVPVKGKYVQNIDFVRGPQNGTLYYGVDVDQLPVSVVEPVPFSITVDQPKVPIVRNGSMKLKVHAHRKDGYGKKILVRMLFRPPGISCPATMTFSEKATELEYEINANASAGLGTWDITLLAESDGGKGQMVVASPFVKVSVEEPFLQMKLNLTTTVQGQKADMLASVEKLRDFDGAAEVQLFGLPAHATTDILKVKKDSTEVHFPITTADNTPVGQHKNMFCTAVIMKNGEPITHRVGLGGVLRVDPKPKKAVAAAKAPVKKVVKNQAAPKVAKPLSRLEQLRLEARQQAAAKK